PGRRSSFPTPRSSDLPTERFGGDRASIWRGHVVAAAPIFSSSKTYDWDSSAAFRRRSLDRACVGYLGVAARSVTSRSFRCVLDPDRKSTRLNSSHGKI